MTSVAASIAGTADYKNVYTRDNLGRSTIIEQTGQAGGNSVHDKRVRLEYNGLDQYTKIIRENKPAGSWQEVVTSNLSYDTLNRLTGLDYERAGTDVFTPYAWTFDKLSRPTQLSGQDGTSGYGYDVNSQLVSADHSFQGDESYSFDLNGNRTMSGWETGANNRLLSDGIFDYAYDNEGNLISRTNIATGELREFLWDYRNRLIQVTDKDNEGNVIQVIKYVYLCFCQLAGQRICGVQEAGAKPAGSGLVGATGAGGAMLNKNCLAQQVRSPPVEHRVSIGAGRRRELGSHRAGPRWRSGAPPVRFPFLIHPPAEGELCVAA